MSAKTDFPVAVLQALQPWIKKKGESFKQIPPTNKEYLVKYVSTSYPILQFTIVKYAGVYTGNIHFLISRNPANRYSLNNEEATISNDQLGSHFKTWQELMESYNTLSSPFDTVEDSILKEYTEEFYSEFELLDDDADVKSYDLKTQILIDKIAETVIKQINTYQGDISEEDKEAIINDAEDLRATQTSSTKKEVASKVSKVLGRIRKVSFELLKDVLKDLAKEGIKALLKGDISQFLLP